MNAPILSELPPPPQGKIGWPWTEQTEIYNSSLNHNNLPKISIVTPSYNQGKFIEETIRSVLLQRYSNLEYIIIDGGSTDNTIEILKKYDPWITYWKSESDQGQTDAINKALKKSSGDIWSYLNSDDLLQPYALYRVAEAFETNKDTFWVGGISQTFDENEIIGFINPINPKSKIEYLTPWSRKDKYVFPCSNVSFMRSEVIHKCGFFDESYDYSMDIEYYVRAIFKNSFSLQIIPHILGGWRWHPESKTLKEGIAYGFRQDEIRIANEYIKYLSIEEQKILNRELKLQNKWLILRKANFYKTQGQKNQSFITLIESIKTYPSLLWFRPWISAVGRIILGL